MCWEVTKYHIPELSSSAYSELDFDSNSIDVRRGQVAGFGSRISTDLSAASSCLTLISNNLISYISRSVTYYGRPSWCLLIHRTYFQVKLDQTLALFDHRQIGNI